MIYPPSGVRCTLRTECDVPSERSVMYPPSGVRCTLRTECDTPSERREAFPSGGGRYSLRAMANRLRVFHWFIGLGSPSSFALQNSLVWSLFFRTVYGFFIGLSVLVRLRVLRCKARRLSRFFCEPSMGLSSVCRFRFAFLFAGGNRPDKVRQFSGETWA